MIESALGGGRGEKHQRLDPGQTAARLGDRRLASEQRDQTFDLAVGEDQWVVIGEATARVAPGQGVGVAGEEAGAALDLDQEETKGREDDLARSDAEQALTGVRGARDLARTADSRQTGSPALALTT